MTQTLEPRISYNYTPYRDQSMIPLFDTGLLDLNQYSIFSANQFVGGDRVIDANQLTIGLTTRYIDTKGTERLSGTLAQIHYINSRDVLKESQFSSSYQSDSSDLYINAYAKITNSLTGNGEWQYNPDDSATNRLTISSKFSPQPGKLIDAGYRFIRSTTTSEEDIKQINIAGQWPIGKGYSTVGRYNYDISKSGVIEGLAGLEYDAGCWSSSVLLHRLSLATTEKPNYTIFISLELGGLGSLGTSKGNLIDVLERNIPGSYKSSDLPDQYREDNYN
jgi:LPS-assembly protein